MLLALAALAAVAPKSAGGAPRSDATAARLQRAVDGVVAAGVPGVIAVMRDGARSVRVARGLARLHPREPIRAGDRFRVGSITKSFIATVVAQLVGEGRLSFDDPVGRWLPGVLPNGQITIRQLLSHRSGLYDYLADPQVVAPYLRGEFAHVWDANQLVAISVAHPPVFAPGSRFGYSNTNYILLGLIIPAVTGRPVETELNERIVGPLKLRSTFLATRQEIPGAHVHGYFFPKPRTPQDTTAVSPTYAGTAGALVSSADDIATFYRALLSGRLLRPDLLQAMEARQDRYGLGLFAVPAGCGLRWGHDGAIAGYSAVALNTKDGRRQFVLFANALTPDDTVGGRAAQNAFGRLARIAACSRL